MVFMVLLVSTVMWTMTPISISDKITMNTIRTVYRVLTIPTSFDSSSSFIILFSLFRDTASPAMATRITTYVIVI